MSATSSERVIDVKEAVQIAVQYLLKLIARIRPRDISLEEAELVGEQWEITLGFLDPREKGVANIFGGQSRIYKKFGINSITGEVLFMRIRKP